MDNEYKVEIIESETVYNGFLKLIRYSLKHTLFGGGWSNIMTRETLQRRHAVAILLHDPELNEIVLVEQFRVGALDSENPWMIELVVGLVEPGESAEEVARREAMEESGTDVQALQQIAHYYNSVGGTNEVTTVFYAGIDASDIGGVHGLKTENENILVRKYSTDDFLLMLKDGKLNTGSLVVAGQWLQNNIQSL